MTINLSQSDIYAIIKRSLSIIGKRSVDDQGNRLFSDITLSTNEEELMNDYISSAMKDIAVEMADFVTASTDEEITVTLPSNHNSAIDDMLKKACVQYCVAYSLYSWFVVTAPKIADKYQGDMNRQLAAVIRMVYEKKPPVEATDIFSTSASIA